MTIVRSITAVRRTQVARCFAALLILLIVLPFTPPFSTCGLGDLIGEAAGDHAPVSAIKAVEEMAAAIPIVDAIVPTARDVTTQAFVLRHVLLPHTTHQTILRL
jgi:hypothetical protein